IPDRKKRGGLRTALATLVMATSAAVPLSMSTQTPAHAESITGGPISRAEGIAPAQDWYLAGLTYNKTPAPDTLVSDVDGTDKYGPDCSGMISMAWHVNPGSSGGYNTDSLPSVATSISTSDLAPGDLLDDQADGHAILFEAWQPDNVHFSY